MILNLNNKCLVAKMLWHLFIWSILTPFFSQKASQSSLQISFLKNCLCDSLKLLLLLLLSSSSSIIQFRFLQVLSDRDFILLESFSIQNNFPFRIWKYSSVCSWNWRMRKIIMTLANLCLDNKVEIPESTLDNSRQEGTYYTDLRNRQHNLWNLAVLWGSSL